MAIIFRGKLILMGKLKRILAIYSIIASTALIIGSPFFLSRSAGLFLLVLISPICIFLWLKISGPEEVNAAKWSLRLLLIIIILTGLVTFAYFLSVRKPACQSSADKTSDTAVKLEELTVKINQLKESEATNEQITQELVKIKEELAKIRRLNQLQNPDIESVSDMLSATASPTPLNK